MGKVKGIWLAVQKNITAKAILLCEMADQQPSVKNNPLYNKEPELTRHSPTDIYTSCSARCINA
jgi:hypothetical protein